MLALLQIPNPCTIPIPDRVKPRVKQQRMLKMPTGAQLARVPRARQQQSVMKKSRSGRSSWPERQS